MLITEEKNLQKRLGLNQVGSKSRNKKKKRPITTLTRNGHGGISEGCARAE